MIDYDYQYKAILAEILHDGVDVEDRTGTGCRKIFNAQVEVDLSGDDDNYHLPVGSLRKTYPRTFFYELLWMLRGSTNSNELVNEHNIKIWEANSSREALDARNLHMIQEGWIGPKAYGYQFRNWNDHYDQLRSVVDGIRNDPNGRRHLINLWNPSDYHLQALPPCHFLYNFVVTGDTLNLKFNQRSSDWILAGNGNLLFASFFLLFMASWTGLKAGRVIQDIADCHVYHNLLEAANLVLDAQPVDRTWKIPKNSSQWNRLFSDALLDCLFFDKLSGESSYDMLVKQYNMDVLDQTNPPLPKEMLQISA